MNYRVVWEIELEADSAEEAAREAMAMLRDRRARVGSFVVKGDDGAASLVDLTPDHAEMGDWVEYLSEPGHIVGGYVAEKANSPLGGTEVVRVVDRPSEGTDADAGRWVAMHRLRLVTRRS